MAATSGDLEDVLDDDLEDVLDDVRRSLGADAALVLRPGHAATLRPVAAAGTTLPAADLPVAAGHDDFFRRDRAVHDLRRLTTAPAWLRATGARSVRCRTLDDGVLVLTHRRPGRLDRTDPTLLAAQSARLTPVPGSPRPPRSGGPDAHAPAAVSAAELQARAVLRATVEGVVLVGRDGVVLSANPAADAMFRCAPGTLVGRDVSTLVAEPLRDAHRTLVSRFRASSPHVMGRGRDLAARRTDGTLFPVEVTLTELDLDPHPNGDAATPPDGEAHGRALVCAMIRDLTERRQYESRLAHLSTHDPLTGLGNRALLADRLDQALHRAHRHGGLVVLVLCDLDDFKGVNDALGHSVGDQLLVQLASRLRETVRPEDTVVRLGGDEFVVVAEQLPDLATAEHLAQRLLRAIREPLTVAGTELYPRASLGLAAADPFRDEPAPADELLADADLALHAAKDAGRDRAVLFEPSMRDGRLGRVRLRADLHRAIERGELVVHYQPMVDLTSHAVTGFEALVRWQHPRYGLLTPDAFLALAAEDDLALAIDEHVLLTACRDIGELGRRRGRALEVWVSCSARSFASPDLRRTVLRALERASLPTDRLVLEVSEPVLLRELPSISPALPRLRSLGVGIAVDDFGTGHTALTYLTRLPFTAVKLDPTATHGIEADPVAEIVVGSVCGLAAALGLVTVADGIEGRRQCAALANAGSERGQGSFLGRPGSAGELDQVLDRPGRTRPYVVR